MTRIIVREKYRLKMHRVAAVTTNLVMKISYDSSTAKDLNVNVRQLQGPVTLTPIAERLAVERSLPVFMTFL